jgi:ATP-binding cassette subfamily B protein
MEEHEWRMRRTEDVRRTWYYDRLLSSSETAAELRAFHLGDHFQSAYNRLRGRLAKEHVSLAGRRCAAEIGAGTAGLVLSGGALAWIVWKALLGRVSLGDLALFYQAFNQGQRLMRALLSDLGQVYRNTLFLHDLVEFLSLKPRVVDPPRPIPAPRRTSADIRFRHVDFRYPGSGAPLLDDFNLHVPAGQIAAIVGANGAGKSTLIKLLCRLYDPQGGRIELDGLDLRDIAIEELRRLIALVLQNPIRYNATVAENVIVGDLSIPRSRVSLDAAARAAAAEHCLSRLPHGYDTMLGKWFTGGLELSGGQWQRVALARSFWRVAPVLALDEPTTGMDPWSESEWLERFRDFAGGRTAVIMTHRFSTAMRADCIHVMAGGQIVESGSHRDLLAAGGRYAQWWRCQTPFSHPTEGRGHFSDPVNLRSSAAAAIG